jgi:hypothetical protein
MGSFHTIRRSIAVAGASLFLVAGMALAGGVNKHSAPDSSTVLIPTPATVTVLGASSETSDTNIEDPAEVEDQSGTDTVDPAEVEDQSDTDD